MDQDQYKKVWYIVRKDVCMKFYDTTGLIYLETDTTGISLGGRLLQVRDRMNCGYDDILQFNSVFIMC